MCILCLLMVGKIHYQHSLMENIWYWWKPKSDSFYLFLNDIIKIRDFLKNIILVCSQFFFSVCRFSTHLALTFFPLQCPGFLTLCCAHRLMLPDEPSNCRALKCVISETASGPSAGPSGRTFLGPFSLAAYLAKEKAAKHFSELSWEVWPLPTALNFYMICFWLAAYHT